MIPSGKSDSLPRDYLTSLRKEPYLLVNLILAGVISVIMAYSGIFSPDRNDYPVECIHEKVTGKPCPSCGLSHSFSLIIRGRIGEAAEWNPYGMRIFIFFASMLFMRIAYSAYYLLFKDTRRQLVLYDIAGSAIIFIIAFYPLLSWLAYNLLN